MSAESANDSVHWSGTYFSGQEIRLSVNSASGHQFNHWLINGEVAGGVPDLALEMERFTNIQPVFRQVDG